MAASKASTSTLAPARERLILRAAEVAQVSAQIVERLAGRTFRPESSSQPIPIHLPIMAQRQKRQQPLVLACAQGGERRVLQAHIKRSEQPKDQQAFRFLGRHGIIHSYNSNRRIACKFSV